MALAASELQLLDAMFPDGALQLDPPWWHQAEDPVLPVSGSLTLELLPHRPALTAQFSIRPGYPENPPETLEVSLSCPAAGSRAGSALDEWVSSRLAEVLDQGSETPLTEVVSGGLDTALEKIQHCFATSPSSYVAPADGNKALSTSSAFEEGAAEGFPEANLGPGRGRSVAKAPEAPGQDNLMEESSDATLPPRAFPGHSGVVEGRIDRQWVTFIAFTSSKIAKEFSTAATEAGLTGFLMVGKPGIVCLEGGPLSIAAFLRRVRTEIFVKIDPQTRKMSLSISEEACMRVRFEGFGVLDFSPGGAKGSATDTGSTSCSMTNKKRTARADLLQLKEFAF